MEVVEKSAEGLSRSYGVRIAAADLGAALDARIAEILPTLRLKGFRPGKVPASHVRRIYGKGLMGEVVEKTLAETSQKVLADRSLRVAAQPDVKPISDMDQVLAGRGDLAYDIEVEVMPDFEPMDVTTLSLDRPVYRASDVEIAEALETVASENRTYEARKGKATAAQDGDQVVIDFIGRIDGDPFAGGTAEDVELIIGSGQFIPGFEPQLVGVRPDGTRGVTVTFPEEYQAEALRGKTAVFEVKVKAVRAPKAAKADDSLAEQLGLADLSALREALRENLDREYRSASRFKTKRLLLDALDTRHDVPLPPRMVEAEFDSIWRQIEQDREAGSLEPEDAEKPEGELRADYRKIAERRVRLGLVLAEIGRRANIQVTDGELGEAMRAEAMRYGEQAQQIFDLLKGNPNIQASMRAPIYEEKVVDFILDQAKVTDRPVSKDELLSEDDPAPPMEAKPAPKAARKPAASKAKEAKPDEPEAAPVKSPKAASAKPAAATKSAKAPASKPPASKTKTGAKSAAKGD